MRKRRSLRQRPWAIWGYGFRPFFLGAGAFAALIIPWWAAAFAWGMPLASNWAPSLWHGHEMLFGFIAAAIAGFLLTAVPSWTGERGFAGGPLILLALVWALGRIAISTSRYLAPAWVAAADLLFLPVLMGLIVPPLARARNRNTPLLAVLVALWATDAAFYWGLFNADAALERRALLIGIDLVLLLITVIGGRIIPAFTRVALKERGDASVVRAWRGVTPAAIIAMLAMMIIDLFRPASRAAGIAAAVAAAIQLVRLAQWQGIRTLRMPIVWVLHLGYLWLALGLALKAISLLTSSAWGQFYLHALTIGAATTLIMAVMTRASLGHTGRPLKIARSIVWAYGLLTAAAAVRIWGSLLLPLPYARVIVLAAALWTLAFLLFLGVYAPIFISARADGKPG